MKRRGFAPILLLISAVALPADAYEPVLHEYVPEDPREDVALAVTTVDGDLPAAIQTPSGLVRAPDTQRTPTTKDRAYAEPLLGAGPASAYHPDRNTSMPDLVRYDDPFSPSIAPYKRLRAFDMVGPDYALHVRDAALSPVPARGEIAPGEEAFYGDITVDLVAELPVRIPSVGPGARVLRMHATPAVAVEIVRDGADNWYVRAPGHRGRVRLIMEVSVARAALGAEPALPAWDAMPAVAPLPPKVARTVETVTAAIGVSRADAPDEALRKLVSYFRSFAPSDEPPRGHDDIYLDLALSKKGVCRHRAFAFLVTALGLGLPARMVVNDAHAWVEVQGKSLYHRIDLGGAARAIEESATDSDTAYQAPPDPFPWPKNADNGASAHLARPERAGQPGTAGARPSGNSAATAADEAVAAALRSESPSAPPSRIVLSAADHEVHRGSPLRLAGSVEVDGAGCSRIRVDVALARRGVKIPIGSTVTDAQGGFSGAIFVPMSFVVGDYEVVASTPGAAQCGAGTTER